MAGFLSDVRNTAIAAGGLVVLAVLFVDPSGVGGKAVKQEEAIAAAHRPRPQAASGWFSAEPEAEPVIEPGARSGPPPPQVAVQPGQIHPPGPVGADFPPGLARR